jgi:hypothetical protein
MIHRKNTLKSILVAIAIGVAGFAAAQTTDGSIAGTAVEGETLVLRGDNGIQREIKVEKTGKYSIRHLPIGTYSVVVVDASGNVVRAQTAEVVVGKTARLL